MFIKSVLQVSGMAEKFYTAVQNALERRGMSVDELAAIPGIGHLPYRTRKSAPNVTLHDFYTANRTLGVTLIAVPKEESAEMIHITDNGAALRALKGTQTVPGCIADKDLPYSAFYEMQNGSRPPLVDVINVWSKFGYELRFCVPNVPEKKQDASKRDVSVPDDFMKLSRAEVSGLLERFFPNR